MAVGTTLSRLTGVIRIVVLGYALGTSYLADDYNLANTIPNIIHDIVLGGVVSATFIPVFVHRLTTRSDDDAWDGISAVTSVTMIVIGAASVLFLVLAPFIIDATTALNHSSQAGQDRRLATELLLLFVPQLACYGFISLGTALLNARRRFGAPMFSSIANNLVLIAVLLYFAFTVKSAARTPGGLLEHRDQLLLLGLGTTAGVVAQAALMVPSLRRAGLRLTWKPDVHHEAVRTIIRLSGWTFGLVAANQVALTVVLALADSIKGAVTAYTYAWTVFQLPYGVVAVSIMAATAPELTAFWSRGDRAGFRRRMAIGLRTTTAIIVPAAAGLLILSHPLAALLFAHGSTTVIGSIPIATALAMLTIGLPGFCVFLYAIRVLQSVQDLRSAFWLYVLENGINIVAAVILVGPLGLRGIALSISIAYTVSAVVALVYVRSRVHGLDADVILRPLLHVGLSTAALVVGAALGSNVSASESTPGLLLRVVVGALAGGAAFIVTAGVLGGRRHRPAGRPHDGPPPSGGRRPDRGRPDGPPRRSRRPGAPPAPAPLPPAGRPPMRPTRLGPSRGAEPESSGRGRLDA
jgi:putative peptidoglycan lipid II flippase